MRTVLEIRELINKKIENAHYDLQRNKANYECPWKKDILRGSIEAYIDIRCLLDTAMTEPFILNELKNQGYQIVSNDNKCLELQKLNGYIHIDKEDRSLSVNMCVPAKVMRLIYELYNVWGW